MFFLLLIAAAVILLAPLFAGLQTLKSTVSEDRPVQHA